MNKLRIHIKPVIMLALCLYTFAAEGQYVNKIIHQDKVQEALLSVTKEKNGFLCSATDLDLTSNRIYFHPYRFDENGNVLNSKVYKPNGLSSYYLGGVQHILNLGDTAFYFAFGVFNGKQKNGLLAKLDSLGDTLWVKQYRYTNDSILLFNGICSDGHSLYIQGFSDSLDPHGDVIVLKTNMQGQEIWRKIVHIPGYQSMNTINCTLDKGIIMGGISQNTYTLYDLQFVIKMDSSGNVTWSRGYGASGIDNWDIGMISQASDSSYIRYTEDPAYELVGPQGFVYGRPQIAHIDKKGNNISYKDFDTVKYDNGFTWGIMENATTAIAGGITAKGNTDWSFIMKINIVTGDSLFYHLLNYKVDSVGGDLLGVGICKNKSIFCVGYTRNGAIEDGWVLVLDSMGCDTLGCGYSAITQVKPSSTKVSVYPNPASNILNLKISNGSFTYGDIFNSSGQKVLTIAPYIFMESFPQVSLYNLAAGAYIIRLRSNTNKTYDIKFVIVR